MPHRYCSTTSFMHQNGNKLQEALSLPLHLREITMENKLHKDYRGIMAAVRCVFFAHVV